jgi:hypothetical protein
MVHLQYIIMGYISAIFERWICHCFSVSVIIFLLVFLVCWFPSFMQSVAVLIVACIDSVSMCVSCKLVFISCVVLNIVLCVLVFVIFIVSYL